MIPESHRGNLVIPKVRGAKDTPPEKGAIARGRVEGKQLDETACFE